MMRLKLTYLVVALLFYGYSFGQTNFNKIDSLRDISVIDSLKVGDSYRIEMYHKHCYGGRKDTIIIQRDNVGYAAILKTDRKEVTVGENLMQLVNETNAEDRAAGTVTISGSKQTIAEFIFDNFKTDTVAVQKRLTQKDIQIIRKFERELNHIEIKNEFIVAASAIYCVVSDYGVRKIRDSTNGVWKVGFDMKRQLFGE